MSQSQRLLAISDIHIDHRENYEALLALSEKDYLNDTLIIAGDATDDLGKLESFFKAILPRFREILFVPGNHELWIRRSEHNDSLAKFNDVLAVCDELGVITELTTVGKTSTINVLPLFSWYHTNTHPEHTLFLDKDNAVDKTYDMWSDFFAARWPEYIEKDIAGHFLRMNEALLSQAFKHPIVTVSHFLPRQDLIFSTPCERAISGLTYRDPHPEFNFSHVAGSKGIEQQLRQLGSCCHVYGHQHRNRCRHVEGVTYVSHCMGYPKERRLGLIDKNCVRPLVLWHEEQGFMV